MERMLRDLSRGPPILGSPSHADCQKQKLDKAELQSEKRKECVDSARKHNEAPMRAQQLAAESSTPQELAHSDDTPAKTQMTTSAEQDEVGMWDDSSKSSSSAQRDEMHRSLRRAVVDRLSHMERAQSHSGLGEEDIASSPSQDASGRVDSAVHSATLDPIGMSGEDPTPMVTAGDVSTDEMPLETDEDNTAATIDLMNNRPATNYDLVRVARGCHANMEDTAPGTMLDELYDEHSQDTTHTPMPEEVVDKHTENNHMPMINGNKLQQVKDIPAKCLMAKRAQSVGYMECTDRENGSCWYVGKVGLYHYIMTCFHVYEKLQDGVKFTFKYVSKDSLKESDFFHFVKRKAYTNESLDYALIEVELHEKGKIDMPESLGKYIRVKPMVPQSGDVHYVIGHVHSNPKTLDHCTVFNPDPKIVKALNEMREFGNLEKTINIKHIIFHCKSFEGSSGGPLFDASGNIVGIHRGGIYLEDRCSGIGVGIMIQPVMTSLQNQMPKHIFAPLFEQIHQVHF